MAEKLNRRGLFGLFAKGAVAAPFVGKALVDGANAAPTPPAPMRKAHLYDHKAVDPTGRFTISTGYFTEYRPFSAEDRAILEHHCDDENCWCFDEDADF